MHHHKVDTGKKVDQEKIVLDKLCSYKKFGYHLGEKFDKHKF